MPDNANMAPCVLLVDDEEAIRNLLLRALEKSNYRVLTAASKADALELFNTNAVNLIICDKNLPDGSGLELVETTRNLDFSGECIVITGYSDTDSAIKSVELGVFRYVRKPFDIDALKMDIQRALETSALRKTLASRSEQLEKRNSELSNALERIQQEEHRRVQSERLAAIGYLSASIAHEINNPLSMLAMAIPSALTALNQLKDLLPADQTGNQARQIIERLNRNFKPSEEAVELLMTLASDLHSLGRGDAVEPVQVHLAEIINSAMRIVRHKLKNKATVTVDVPDDLTIKGRPNRLVQVFINLLTNAGRAIRTEDPDNNKIQVLGYEDDKHAIIEVADTGVGITKENISRIFERFVSLSGLGHKEGSGIGLSIVKELVEEHNGVVEVESEPGKGSKFMVKFPLANIRRSVPPPMAVNGRYTPSEFIRAKRLILFVDRTRDHLSAYGHSFGQMHDVLMAQTFDEALQLIDEHVETLDVVVAEITADQAAFKQFQNTVLNRFSDMDNRFIYTADSAFVPLPDLTVPVLKRPFRPAELLAAIYRIPPRRPSVE